MVSQRELIDKLKGELLLSPENHGEEFINTLLAFPIDHYKML